MEKARNKELNGFNLLGATTMFDHCHAKGLYSIVHVQWDFIDNIYEWTISQVKVGPKLQVS
jgi:hypothetical protein